MDQALPIEPPPEPISHVDRSITYLPKRLGTLTVYLNHFSVHEMSSMNITLARHWAVVVAQLAKRLLPTPEVRGSIPDISKVFIE